MRTQDRTRPPLSVLVVDCDADTADSLAELLDLYGHAAGVASDGASALRQIDAAVPDVVLLELRLPRMDGCELVRRIRERCAGRRTRPLLVAITGCDAGDKRLRWDGARVDLHLVKPVEPGVLIGVLERFRRVVAPSIPVTECDPPPEEEPAGPRSSGVSGRFLATAL